MPPEQRRQETAAPAHTPRESGQPAVPADGDLARWWRAYLQEGSPEARERLILAYAPLVKYVAGRVAISLPAHVEFDDLVSYGIFGLIDAIEKYDAERGVKFETYVVARIRGAILDGLRSTDWVPRSVRKRARELETALAALESRLGRSATEEEVSQELGISLAEYHQLLGDLAAATLNSLDEVWTGDSDAEGHLSFMSIVQDTSSADPAGTLESAALLELLADAIAALPERERLVVTLYYYEELTLKEIGQVLGVTESRVSQIHTQAILRLRGKVRGAWLESA